MPYSRLEQLCIDGEIDSIYDNLIFLVSMNILTEDQLSFIFSYVSSKGKTVDVVGLLELSDWIKQVWMSYIKYNKLPQFLLTSLSQRELPHISANYLSYIGSSKHKNYSNVVDTKEFNSLVSHFLQFYPKLNITRELVEISAKLKNISDSNYNEIIQLLYASSRKLEFDNANSLSSVVRQKIKSQLNKVRLQLESLQQRQQNNKEDDFSIFLREEGVLEAINSILDRLEIRLEVN